MSGTATVAVVGCGIAALQTIQHLRTLGFDGDITVITDEDQPPYDRPPLSKGRTGVTDSLLPLSLQDFGVNRLLGRATGLHGVDAYAAQPLSIEVVTTGDGSERGGTTTSVAADYVVVATGAQAIVPPQWAEVPAVHTLRTRTDAEQMWRSLDGVRPPARVVVIGASWIGMEFASVAATEGMQVTVLERASHVLPLVPPEIGRVIASWAQQAGVDLDLGASVTSVQSQGDSALVRTASQEYEADFVLAALGVHPATSWLDGSGLSFGPSGALRVNEYLRTTDPRVLGIGDAVERWSPRYQTWMPGGHWQDARDEGSEAARTIMATIAGSPEPADGGYDAVPYFWSELFAHTLLWAGRAPSTPPMPRMVVRGRLEDESWAVCWLNESDQLVAIMASGRPRDIMMARKAMAADPHGSPQADPRCLTDPHTPLKNCLGG